MLPVLTFIYRNPDHITKVAEILHLGTSAIKELSDRYVLISHESVDFHNDCPIHEIMYDDIMNSQQPIKDRYNFYVQQYGQEMVDEIFPKDEELVKQKILNTLLFAMDKVYKNNMLLVRIMDLNVTYNDLKSSMPNIIYSVIQENFEIMQQNLINHDKHIIIKKKRRKKDGNDAN